MILSLISEEIEYKKLLNCFHEMYLHDNLYAMHYNLKYSK